MEFLAGRNAEVDVGGAHAAGGKKKKRNKRRKNLKRKFHTLFFPELSMTEVTQDTIFNPLTSSLRVKPSPPQEDAPYVFGLLYSICKICFLFKYILIDPLKINLRTLQIYCIKKNSLYHNHQMDIHQNQHSHPSLLFPYHRKPNCLYKF
jgi:hypothetical protein